MLSLVKKFNVYLNWFYWQRKLFIHTNRQLSDFEFLKSTSLSAWGLILCPVSFKRILSFPASCQKFSTALIVFKIAFFYILVFYSSKSACCLLDPLTNLGVAIDLTWDLIDMSGVFYWHQNVITQAHWQKSITKW